jgi:DNA-binding winged helix-turn-helix (wHTH) protein
MSARDPQDGAESILRFGTFELDAATCELRRRGILVPLPRQPARTLRLLVLRAGKLVTREDLRRELWGDEVFVDYDSGLAACINQVRVALGDSAASPRFVETLRY